MTKPVTEPGEISIVSPQDQFKDHVEEQRAKDLDMQKPAPLGEIPRAHKDISILATAFQHGAEWWKDLEEHAETPAIRWLAKGHKEELEFVSARIRELLDPTVSIKPEIAANAIEATYQANLSVMKAMDQERSGKNGNGA